MITNQIQIIKNPIVQNTVNKIQSRIQSVLGKHTQVVTRWFRVYGLGFAAYAILMNILDELLIPALLAYFGHPVMGGLFILGDIDWLTYPLYFVVIQIWDKI